MPALHRCLGPPQFAGTRKAAWHRNSLPISGIRQAATDESKRAKTTHQHHHQAPACRPLVDPVVGGSLGVCEPALATWCLEPRPVPQSPLPAGTGPDLFLQARDAEADFDHGENPPAGEVIGGRCLASYRSRRPPAGHLNPAHFRGIFGEGQMPSRPRGNLPPASGLRLLLAACFVCLPT